MVLLTLVNGHARRTVNGVNGATGNAATPPALDPSQVYDYHPTKLAYVEGYSINEIIDARPFADPYASVVLPPFARPVPIDYNSFREGHKPTQDELSSEITMSFDKQVPLAAVLDAVIQDAFGNLTELAEVMPGFNDRERKMRLIQYAQSTRKQIIKVYALSKWARVAEDVQKAVNIMSFLTRYQTRVRNAGATLATGASILVPLKRRNADLVTAIDVLSTGAYKRLPSGLETYFATEKPITNEEIISTLREMDGAILQRLRLREVIPVAMSQYHIEHGRVTFKVPDMFEADLTLTGPGDTDYWYALDVKLLVQADTDGPTVSETSSEPTLWHQTVLLNMVNEQLGMNADQIFDVGHPFAELPKRPFRDPSMMDTPLVRAFNTLQMLALSYQLEILHQQAMRFLPLGWQDFITISMNPVGRREFSLEYWKRPQQQVPPALQGQQGRIKQDLAPLNGGSLVFTISDELRSTSSNQTNRHVDRLLMQLETTAKGGPSIAAEQKKPTDVVQEVKLLVEWKPLHNALVPGVAQEDMRLEVSVDPSKLNLPLLLRKITFTHSRAILKAVRAQLLRFSQKSIFGDAAEVEMTEDPETGCALRVSLVGSQAVTIAIDMRTGRIVLKDAGVLAASNRDGRFRSQAAHVNRWPYDLVLVILQLKYQMILSQVTHQAQSLGLQATTKLPIPAKELTLKFGNVRVCLWVHLGPYPDYYLAMVVNEEGLKWALVNLKEIVIDHFRERSIDDFGWLDSEKIGGGNERQLRWDRVVNEHQADPGKLHVPLTGPRRGKAEGVNVKTEVLRELYAFCCARVSHTKVEQQLKSRGIPWTSVFSTSAGNTSDAPGSKFEDLSPFSATARSVPKIWVKIGDIIRSSEVTALACENVKMKVVDWWCERPCRVVTSVRLRDVEPVSEGKSSTQPSTAGMQVIHPSRRITYDPASSIISFISDSVDTCVDEFLEEWEKIQKVANLVREVRRTQLKRGWDDIRILSFDLQRVVFAYHSVYTVIIEWVPLSARPDGKSNGAYEMEFGVVPGRTDGINPHQALSSSLSSTLRTEASRSMEKAVEGLIWVLRDTLKVLLAVQQVKREAHGRVTLLFKSATWYRCLYGTRHALDIRALTGARVGITDVVAKVPGSPFQPIADFDDITAVIARAFSTSHSQPSPPVVFIGDGLVCVGDVASEVILKLHHALAARFWPSDAGI
ncbi:mediator complex subunit [Tulasnella sp. JGI-2019a]|nr:mediator complex subunit [Tulasnella sp. JGI-2019a]KAG9005015.1 mediator complex subunit [Tulasnella sp. JGI-2019a]